MPLRKKGNDNHVSSLRLTKADPPALYGGLLALGLMRGSEAMPSSTYIRLCCTKVQADLEDPQVEVCSLGAAGGTGCTSSRLLGTQRDWRKHKQQALRTGEKDTHPEWANCTTSNTH